MAVRLQMKLGVIAEPDRVTDSPDTIVVVEPSVGSVARSKGNLYLIVTSTIASQRAQEATRIRAEGQAKAQEIRAEADRDRTVLLANTQRDAQILRGAGDAEATKIYNEAFSRDPEFFDLYRSLQAMRTGLTGNNTTFVGSPTGDFFRYFEQNQGAPKKPQQ